MEECSLNTGVSGCRRGMDNLARNYSNSFEQGEDELAPLNSFFLSLSSATKCPTVMEWQRTVIESVGSKIGQLGREAEIAERMELTVALFSRGHSLFFTSPSLSSRWLTSVHMESANSSHADHT